MYLCPLFFQFSSRVGRRALSTPRARQWVLISCLFLMSQCVCQSQPPVLPTPSPFPCGACKFLFHICDSLSVLKWFMGHTNLVLAEMGGSGSGSFLHEAAVDVSAWFGHLKA